MGARRPRAARHTAAATVVAVYLLAAAMVVAAHRLVPVPEWLALHLLVLGAATNAVFVWSRFFVGALLHARPGSARPALVRLVILNAGVAAVLAGVSGGLAPVAVGGCSGGRCGDRACGQPGGDGQVADTVALAAGLREADQMLERLLIPVLGMGVVTHILAGALTFLLPVTVGGGPAGNRRLTAILERGWRTRSILGNAGVAMLVVLPGEGWPRAAAWRRYWPGSARSRSWPAPRWSPGMLTRTGRWPPVVRRHGPPPSGWRPAGHKADTVPAGLHTNS